MSIEFGLHFGALADPMAKQLKNQNLKFDPEKVKTFERYQTAMMTLRFADLLSDSQMESVNKKLFNKIKAHIKQKNKLS